MFIGILFFIFLASTSKYDEILQIFIEGEKKLKLC
jgi:hypothetical protein